MKKRLVSEVKQFQKLAGLLKEYIESDPGTITQAFQQAGIELDKPVVYICDYGNPGGTDKPVKALGGKLLQELEAERIRDEEDNPDYNEEEGITYEYGPHQGGGELLGDYTPEAVEGLKCKLNVYFSDSHLYEIWQAGEMNEWHPDDPASVDVDDIEDKDPDDYDDVSEDTDTRGRTSYDLVKGPNEDPLVKRILVNLHNKYGKEGYHYDPYMKRLTVYGEASEDEAIVDMLSALFDQPEYQDLSEDDYSENPAPNDDESQSGDTAVDNINEVRRLQKIAFKK